MSEGRRGVAELSLAQLPQVLAWHELECAPSVTGLAKLDIEEARAKHALRLDIFNADLLELVEDLLDNVRVDENVLGNDVLDQGRLVVAEAFAFGRPRFFFGGASGSGVHWVSSSSSGGFSAGESACVGSMLSIDGVVVFTFGAMLMSHKAAK